MKKLFILMIIAGCICICSCNNSKNGSNNNSNSSSSAIKDTVYNENIQSVFFDTPFGASKEDVIKNFKTHNFIPYTQTSSDALIHFHPIQSQKYSFGNMTWDMLDVGFVNGKFNYIRFMNASKDKVSAIQNYENVLSAVSAKYEMMEQAPNDTTFYKLSIAYSKVNRFVFVYCFRYETVTNEIRIGTVLEYLDKNFNNEVSEEL